MTIIHADYPNKKLQLGTEHVISTTDKSKREDAG